MTPMSQGVPRWPATIALLAVGLLLAVAATQLDVSSLQLPLVIIGILAVPLTLASIYGRHDIRHRLGMIALAILTVAVALSAVYLVRQLLYGVIAAPNNAMAKYAYVDQSSWPIGCGRVAWCNNSPQSGPSLNKATANTTSSSPISPKTCSSRENLTRQITSHTANAASGIQSR